MKMVRLAIQGRRNSPPWRIREDLSYMQSAHARVQRESFRHLGKPAPSDRTGIDLYPNPDMARILEHFFATGKVVGAICPGAIA
jgi:hypothetical protein